MRPPLPFRSSGPVLSERGRLTLAVALTIAAAWVAAGAALEPHDALTGEPIQARPFTETIR